MAFPPDRGAEDVRFVPVEQGTNIAPIMPGGRSPSLLADSIQPVVVLGDGKGDSSNSNAITQSSFCTGAMVFGSQGLGGPYYEFHSQKVGSSALGRAIVGGLAKFLDSFIPLPLFKITVGGATNERPERAVLVLDVQVSYQIGGSTGPAIPVIVCGFEKSTFRPFRAMNNQTLTSPGAQGEQGDEPLNPEARFYAGQLSGNLPHSKNPTPGDHVIYHPKATTNWFGLAGQLPYYRPFAHIQPFWLPQDYLFYIGQTDRQIGVANGTDSQFCVNVYWREMPI